MISMINNGQLAQKTFVLQLKKRVCVNILNVLWDEGFILGYKVTKNNNKFIKIFLKYQNGVPVTKSLKILSKPSLRIYYSAKQLWKLDSKNVLIILSTNKGFFTNTNCKKRFLGGEPVILIK